MANNMTRAILVDVDHFQALEHLAEELFQASTTDSRARAERHLFAAIEICQEIKEGWG